MGPSPYHAAVFFFRQATQNNMANIPTLSRPINEPDPNAPGSAIPLFGNTVPLAQVAMVVADAQKAASDVTAASLTSEPIRSSLLNHLTLLRQQAVDAKQNSGVTDRLLDSQRRRHNDYSEARLAQLKKYNLPVYFPPLTQTKCIHTEAWLRDLTMPYGAKIWSCDATEVPDLPDGDKSTIEQGVIQDAVLQIAAGADTGLQAPDLAKIADEQVDAKLREERDFAKKRAKRMESEIFDNLQDCDWAKTFEEFRSNVVTYGTGFLKGPYTKTVKKAKWVNGKRVVTDEVIPVCAAPSPHDVFPAPWAKDVQDGYVIERIKTYRPALNAVRKLEYYQKSEIEDLLKEQPVYTAGTPASTQYSDNRRAQYEDKGNIPNDDRIECWEFHGSLPGFMLTDWGVENVDPAEDYEMVVLWSGTHILKVMPAWNDTGCRGYFKAVFKPVVGSFWGIGVPNMMSAAQDRACSVMTQLLANMAWHGGPLIWVYMDRLVRPEDAQNIYGGKVLLYKQDDMSPTTSAPMGVFNIEDKTGELNALYQGCLTDADNESGVPAYMYGANQQNSAGAVRTFSGLSTLMNAAARGVKDALMNMDQALGAFIQNWADWVNEYSDKAEIKGDVRVISSGATGLFIQEMQMDRMAQMLDRVKDPNVLQSLGMNGVAFMVSLIRGMAQMLKQDVTYLPNEMDILDQAKKAQQAALMMPQPQQGNLNMRSPEAVEGAETEPAVA